MASGQSFVGNRNDFIADMKKLQQKSYEKFCKDKTLDETLLSSWNQYVEYTDGGSSFTSPSAGCVHRYNVHFYENGDGECSDALEEMKTRYNVLSYHVQYIPDNLKDDMNIANTVNDGGAKSTSNANTGVSYVDYITGKYYKTYSTDSTDSSATTGSTTSNPNQGVKQPSYSSNDNTSSTNTTTTDATSSDNSTIETLNNNTASSESGSDPAQEVDTNTTDYGSSETSTENTTESEGYPEESTSSEDYSNMSESEKAKMTDDEMKKKYENETKEYLEVVGQVATTIVEKNLDNILQSKIKEIKEKYGIDPTATIEELANHEDAKGEIQNVIRGYILAEMTDENQKVIKKAIEDTKQEVLDMIDNQLGKKIINPLSNFSNDLKSFNNKLDFLAKLSDIDLAKKIGTSLQDTLMKSTGIGEFADNLANIDKELAQYGVLSNFGGAFTGMIDIFSDRQGQNLQNAMGKDLAKISKELTTFSTAVSKAVTDTQAYEDKVKGLINQAEDAAKAFVQREEEILIDEVSKAIHLDLSGISSNIDI